MSDNTVESQRENLTAKIHSLIDNTLPFIAEPILIDDESYIPKLKERQQAIEVVSRAIQQIEEIQSQQAVKGNSEKKEESVSEEDPEESGSLISMNAE